MLHLNFTTVSNAIQSVLLIGLTLSTSACFMALLFAGIGSITNLF